MNIIEVHTSQEAALPRCANVIKDSDVVINTNTNLMIRGTVTAYAEFCYKEE